MKDRGGGWLSLPGRLVWLCAVSWTPREAQGTLSRGRGDRLGRWVRTQPVSLSLSLELATQSGINLLEMWNEVPRLHL